MFSLHYTALSLQHLFLYTSWITHLLEKPYTAVAGRTFVPSPRRVKKLKITRCAEQNSMHCPGALISRKYAAVQRTHVQECFWLLTQVYVLRLSTHIIDFSNLCNMPLLHQCMVSRKKKLSISCLYRAHRLNLTPVPWFLFLSFTAKLLRFSYSLLIWDIR